MNVTPELVRSWTPWAAVAWFGALFLFERLRPLRRPTRAAGWRWGVNAAAVALGFGAAGLTVAPVIALMLNWTGTHRFGLLQWIPLPGPARFAGAVLLLDLSFYYWHRFNHAVPWLWRFHNVHHIDPDLDSTTSFRFHAGEIAYSAVFRAVQIALIGPGTLAFAVYEGLFIGGTLFHHSNVRLPVELERALNRVFVTPRMHGVHHSIVRDETNSNYSVVFRWWDPLHRSLRLNVTQDRIRIGVAAYTREDDNSFNDLIALPFRRQRAYWRTPDGAPSYARPGESAAACKRMPA